MTEALLVIDVQNEYFTGLLPVTYPPGSLTRILEAMDAAHAARIPVIVIRHSNNAPGAPAFVPGTSGWELYADVKKRPCDLLVEKTLPGSFTRTNLGPWLEEHGIKSLVIAGYMTQMCCDTTARQALHRGYAVKFLADATGTLTITNPAGTVKDADLHHAVLVVQQSRFSQVMTTRDWIRSIAPASR